MIFSFNSKDNSEPPIQAFPRLKDEEIKRILESSEDIEVIEEHEVEEALNLSLNQDSNYKQYS